MQFRKDSFANPAGLAQFLQEQRGLAKIRDNKLIIRRDWADDRARIQGAFAVSRDLAKLSNSTSG